MQCQTRDWQFDLDFVKLGGQGIILRPRTKILLMSVTSVHSDETFFLIKDRIESEWISSFRLAPDQAECCAAAGPGRGYSSSVNMSVSVKQQKTL